MTGLQGSFGLWLIVAAPAVGAVLGGLAACLRRGERGVPLATLGATALAGLAALGNRPSRAAGYLGDTGVTWLTIGDGFRIGMGVHLDHLAWVMVGVVVAVSFLVQLYSVGYMKGEVGYGRYFAYLSLFTASMLGLVLADNLFQLYACWELVGICSYLLIGFWWRKPSAAAASKKAFVVTRFGDVGFLLGILLLATAAGSFDLEQVRSAFWAVGSGAARGSVFMSNEVFVWLVPVLLLCGAVGKSAQFPLHIWLPDAMEGPTPVSALIHAATMVAAGVYMVARLMWMFTASSVGLPLSGAHAVPLDVVLLIGAATALIGATIAVVQMDIKKVLAYSTISQLGFMMMALGAGSGSGQSTAMFHLVTHAFFKALLFLAAGSVIHALHHSADPNDLRRMGGLLRRLPVTAITCGAGVLALAGLPPFSGFWSKDAVIGLLLHRSGAQVLGVAAETPALRLGADPWAAGIGAAIALTVSVLTAFYAFRMWLLAFGGKARSREAEGAHESPIAMTAPLIALAVPSVLVGWWLHHGHLLHGYLTGSGAGPDLEMHAGVAGLATALGLVGAAGAWALYRGGVGASDPIERLPKPAYALLVNLWFVDRVWTWVGGRAVMVLAAVVAWFDRHVVDGGVRGGAQVVAGIGAVMRRSSSGQTQTYAAAVIGGTVALIVLLALYETAVGPALGQATARLTGLVGMR
ncbi:MAG: NADH-quinone oxidoreductase subunit L [Armatimonadetes bacterium]|nr:NADH-quinone oxidoreductase subunit L [Armatimonadota bacterium]